MPLAFLVPGRLDQLTGGYLFDRRIVDGVRTGGRHVEAIELAGSFPDADEIARAAVGTALAGLPDGAAAVIDGLALLAAEDCLAGAARRVRLIGFVHHPLASETGLSASASVRIAGLEGGLLRLLRGAICPSEEMAAALRAYGVAAARIAVVPPGTARPASSRPAARQPGPARLLTVASVTPRKGHLVLIAALARLGGLDWRLRCVGSLARDPAAVTALREAITRHGLADRVTLVGERPTSELATEYQAADCFVLPSFHEGYGMAFAEALSHGLPVVAARAGAVPSTVPESAGLLVPPGDVGALAEALRRIIAEPDLRERLAAGALAAGALLPDWDHAVRCWAAAFDRLVA